MSATHRLITEQQFRALHRWYVCQMSDGGKRDMCGMPTERTEQHVATERLLRACAEIFEGRVTA